MPSIRLETHIEAPIERVFDLSRSIDLHKLSTKGTDEEAIEGKISGLIGLNETVTWRAKHFGIYQKLTVKIVKYDKPNMFADEMLKGTFASMRHLHLFENEGDGTKMTDVFEFTSPLGFLGRLADYLFLERYMAKLLLKRNEELKAIAESDRWKELLAF
jgi:ligand-binding SRPBCC domain-containing protein